jgi:hypothetical protein
VLGSLVGFLIVMLLVAFLMTTMCEACSPQASLRDDGRVRVAAKTASSRTVTKTEH